MTELVSLIEDVRGGNHGSYAAIVERFQDMAVGYATAQLSDPHLAEDAAQESFLAAYVDLGQLRDPAAFPGWFRRIVHKHCDRIRRQQRVHLVPLDDDRWEATVEAPTTLVETQDRDRLLRAAIRRLPDIERTVILLHYQGEYSQAEVAAFLEIPVTTVNNRMHSARQRLKQEMLDMKDKTPSTPSMAARVQEQVEAMTQLHNSLTEPIRSALAESLNDEVSVRVLTVEHKPGLHALRGIGNPCCAYSFEPKPGQPRIAFDIQMELVACIVGRKVGRGDDARIGEIGHQVNEQEWHLTNAFAKKMMSAVVALWSDVVEMEVGLPELETNPMYLMDTWIGAQDPMLHVQFEVAWDQRTSRIDLVYPAPSLAAGLALLQGKAA